MSMPRAGNDVAPLSSGLTTQLLGDVDSSTSLPPLTLPRAGGGASSVPVANEVPAYPRALAGPSCPASPQPPASAPAGPGDGQPGPVSGPANDVPRAVEATGQQPAGAAGGASESAHEASKGGDDIDDLSRRVYERIRDRLKAELYLDRERAGQLSDLTV